MKNNFIKVFMFLLWANILPLADADGHPLYFLRPVRNIKTPCRTDDGLTGECKRVTECNNLPLTITSCTSEIRGICCPVSTHPTIGPVSTHPTVRPVSTHLPFDAIDEGSCRTDDGSIGVCVGVFDCVPSPEKLSLCAGSRRGVCCPSTVLKSTECGISHDSSSFAGFIAGGTDATPGAWPWMTALFTKDETNLRIFRCGGALIKDQFILTAAHCVEDIKENGLSIFVRVGGYDLSMSADLDLKSEEIEVEDIHIHHRHVEKRFNNDIAILKLKRKANITHNTICISGNQDGVTGGRAVLTGWGFTTQGSQVSTRTSDILQQIEFSVAATNTCADQYLERAPRDTRKLFPEGINDQTFVCATVTGNVADVRLGHACMGDSGGPLMAHSDGRWEVIGVVSVGSGICGKDLPTLYTRVANFKFWIQQVTRS